MDKISQILKAHWLTILFALGLLSISIISIQEQREIQHLKYEVSDLEEKLSSLEDEKDEMENALDHCNSVKNDYENRSTDQSFNNWSLQRRIRDLEDELEDCERKLRDYN